MGGPSNSSSRLSRQTTGSQQIWKWVLVKWRIWSALCSGLAKLYATVAWLIFCRIFQEFLKFSLFQFNCLPSFLEYYIEYSIFKNCQYFNRLTILLKYFGVRIFHLIFHTPKISTFITNKGKGKRKKCTYEKRK